MSTRMTTAIITCGGVSFEAQVPVEYRPDDVFEACNATDYEPDAQWAQELRRTWRAARTSSMSVGDTIVHAFGEYDYRWTCKPVGWECERQECD